MLVQFSGGLVALGLEWRRVGADSWRSELNQFIKESPGFSGFVVKGVKNTPGASQLGLTRNRGELGHFSGAALLADATESLVFVEPIGDSVWICAVIDHQVLPGYDRVLPANELDDTIGMLLAEHGLTVGDLDLVLAPGVQTAMDSGQYRIAAFDDLVGLTYPDTKPKIVSIQADEASRGRPSGSYYGSSDAHTSDPADELFSKPGKKRSSPILMAALVLALAGVGYWWYAMLSPSDSALAPVGGAVPALDSPASADQAEDRFAPSKEDRINWSPSMPSHMLMTMLYEAYFDAVYGNEPPARGISWTLEKPDVVTWLSQDATASQRDLFSLRRSYAELAEGLPDDEVATADELSKASGGLTSTISAYRYDWKVLDSEGGDASHRVIEMSGRNPAQLHALAALLEPSSKAFEVHEVVLNGEDPSWLIRGVLYGQGYRH